jgi:hypothetical protein
VNLGRDWELLSQDIRRSFALLGFRDATRAEAKFFDLRGTNCKSREPLSESYALSVPVGCSWATAAGAFTQTRKR